MFGWFKRRPALTVEEAAKIVYGVWCACEFVAREKVDPTEVYKAWDEVEEHVREHMRRLVRDYPGRGRDWKDMTSLTIALTNEVVEPDDGLNPHEQRIAMAVGLATHSVVDLTDLSDVPEPECPPDVDVVSDEVEP